MTKADLYELFMAAAIGMNFGAWQQDINAGAFAFCIAGVVFVKLGEVK